MNDRYLEVSEQFATWLVGSEKSKGVRKGDRVDGHCPRRDHDDDDPSFSYYVRSSAWKCSCGSGRTSDLLLELGLQFEERVIVPAQPIPERKGSNSSVTVVAEYEYKDELGAALFKVTRLEPKSFRQSAFADGEWRSGKGAMDGVRRVPYRLPELLAAPISQRVLIVDGEKDVDSGLKLGYPCTCHVGGMGSWAKASADLLVGRPVTIVADKDKAGKIAGEKLQSLLAGLGIEAPIVEMPGEGVKDLTDWIGAGGSIEELRELAEHGESWEDVTKSETFEFADLAHLVDEKLEYLIHPVIPKGVLVMIQGAPKAGKSVFALNLALSAAMGVSPIDGFAVERPIRVLVVEYEDSKALVIQRASSYLLGRGLGAKEFPQGLKLSSYPELYLDNEKYADALVRFVKKHNIELVVLDTLSYVHRAKDENSSADMKPLMSSLKRMTSKHNFSVLIVHHTGKGAGEKVMTDRSRGSTVISAAPDVIIDWGIREPGSHVTPVNFISKYDSGRSFKVEYQKQADGGVRFVADWSVESKPEKKEHEKERREDILKLLVEETKLNPAGILLPEFIQKRCSKYSQNIVYRVVKLLEKQDLVSMQPQTTKRGAAMLVKAITATGKVKSEDDWEVEVDLDD